MAVSKHRDIFAADIVWREGTEDGISYARFPMDEANPHAPTLILSKFEPGTRVPPHSHGCNYCEYILEGEQRVGKVLFGKGDIRLVKGGSGYGPIMVGADGCTVLIVFQDGARSLMEMKGV